MFPFNSKFHYIVFQSIVLLASNALVTADTECIDSPLPFIHTGNTIPRTCEFVGDNFSDCTPEASSHCPSTCDECSTYMCLDSVSTFVYNNQFLTCSTVASLPPTLQELVCAAVSLASTCRATCDYCPNTTVPSSIPPSSPPSVASTYFNYIDINFDEASLDFGDFDDYGYYYDISLYDYYHPDIMLLNFGYYPGHLSPGTGYEYGVITPLNAGFNKYGDPVVIQCLGGSFYIESMWLTSAWQDDAPVDFFGTKNDGTIVSFSLTLSPTMPMFVDGEFDDFTDLATLLIDTPREGDIAVIDQMQIGITEQCDMTDSFEEDEEGVMGLNSNKSLRKKSHSNKNSSDREDNPGFSPIFPRLH